MAFLNFDVDGDLAPAKILDTRGLVSNAARVVLQVGAPTGTSYVDVLFVGTDPKAKP
ncbi:MAG: hypothetical protein GTN49_07580 [candidate division Zixibacteria bacterium]|nr:hypothetical protein [candidate division Zixibacteria bacterium]